MPERLFDTTRAQCSYAYRRKRYGRSVRWAGIPELPMAAGVAATRSCGLAASAPSAGWLVS